MTHLITLPGYGGSGEKHWQSLWETSSPEMTRFCPANWNRPDLSNWVDALEQAVTNVSSPPILIAHSLSCLLVPHWTKHSQKKIAGAFLVAPPDPTAPDFPTEAATFQNAPTNPLPFPSLIIASSNDPYGTIEYQRQCAKHWQAKFIDIGPAGHINGESGLGDWPQGRTLLHDFQKNTIGDNIDLTQSI